MPGAISKVVVKLKGLSHTDLDDLDIHTPRTEQTTPGDGGPPPSPY
ncbi:MAG: hypothetical protein ABL950_13245 [Nitrospira sp.]